MNFKKVLATGLSLLFTAPLSSMAMKEKEENNENEENKTLCAICYDFDLDDPANKNNVVSMRCCGHRFCAQCMAEYFKRNEHRNRYSCEFGEHCPLCRRVSTTKQNLLSTEYEDIIRAEDLPEMEGKDAKEILDELFENTLKGFKGIGTDSLGVIMVSNFWPMRSDKIRYEGLPYTVERGGKLCPVRWPEGIDIDVRRQKIKEHNAKTLKEEEARWRTLTDAEVDDEIAGFREYLNAVSVKNPEAWKKLKANKRNKLVEDYTEKVNKVRQNVSREKREKLLNLCLKQS